MIGACGKCGNAREECECTIVEGNRVTARSARFFDARRIRLVCEHIATFERGRAHDNESVGLPPGKPCCLYTNERCSFHE